ncbi:MAG: Nucleotidyltransferase substrate binding protein like [Candidatus Kentron sp. G]|nr:MAG: Nucleotidyltransferase substrate binding protein like [Candidatus Kentron sp. G]VFN05208.1 MAG: Nucleotidyltransferase substrate binding protein like [Candidatus Kentron sp. G]
MGHNLTFAFTSMDTTFFNRCILALEQALECLGRSAPESIEYDMYRSACVKEFEIILEQTGKLLRKCLGSWFHSAKAVDALVFKDLFRHAANHGLMDVEQAERWLVYRDNRNDTAHDYGVHFAESTLILLPGFVEDARRIEQVFKNCKHD